MAGSQTAAPPPVQRTASRPGSLQQASLAILILLIVQVRPRCGVNPYVTLPAAGHPGHGSFFGNGPLLALHAGLGMFRRGSHDRAMETAQTPGSVQVSGRPW